MHSRWWRRMLDFPDKSFSSHFITRNVVFLQIIKVLLNSQSGGECSGQSETRSHTHHRRPVEDTACAFRYQQFPERRANPRDGDSERPATQGH